MEDPARGIESVPLSRKYPYAKKVEVEIFDRLVEITGPARALLLSYRNQEARVTLKDWHTSLVCFGACLPLLAHPGTESREAVGCSESTLNDE